MEQHGNLTTFNVENVLRQNILNSEYYRKTCLGLSSWSEVIDEIYYNVSHVEPWMSGNARGPSTAFCLLYRLFQLKLDVEEIRATVDHSDSPYIRAVGFLYLRYVCDPNNLWSWVDRYVLDSEEFAPSPQGKSVTMGEYVRDLLLDQYYFETIFPRIPKKVADDIVEQLRAWQLPTVAKGNAGAGGADRRGVDDGSKRPASVKASLSVAFGQRAPNRAGVRESGLREPGRGRDPSPGKDGHARRTPPPLAPSGSGRRRSRSRSPSQVRARQRSRSRERDRERDRGHYERRRSPSPRGRDRYERSRSDRSPAGRRRSRSRSRSRQRDRYAGAESRGGRDAREVFGSAASRPPAAAADLDRIKSEYGASTRVALHDDRGGQHGGGERRHDERAEEVYRLGGRSSWR